MRYYGNEQFEIKIDQDRINNAWHGVKNLQIVNALTSSATAHVGFYFYPPSVGRVDTTEAKVIVFVYANESFPASFLQYHSVTTTGMDQYVKLTYGTRVIDTICTGTTDQYDFGTVRGPCPTVCGGICLLRLVSGNKMYMLADVADSNRLFGKDIDTASGIFDTSDSYKSGSVSQYALNISRAPSFILFKNRDSNNVLIIIRGIDIQMSECQQGNPFCCNGGVPAAVHLEVYISKGMKFDRVASTGLLSDKPKNRLLVQNRRELQMNRYKMIVDLQGRLSGQGKHSMINGCTINGGLTAISGF